MTKQIIFFLLFAVLGRVGVQAQEQDQNDEAYFADLAIRINSLAMDTSRLNLLDQLCHKHPNADTVCKYAAMQMYIADRFKVSYHQARARSFLCWANLALGKLGDANEYGYSAIMIADSIGSKVMKANNYYNIGLSFSQMNDASRAYENLQHAHDIYKEIGDTASVCEVLRVMGWNYYINGLFSAAESCYRNAYEADSIRGDRYDLAEDRLGAASSLLARYEYEGQANPALLHQAHAEYLTVLAMANDVQNDNALAAVCEELPLVLLHQAEFEEAPDRRAELYDSCRHFIATGYNIVNSNRYQYSHRGLDFAAVHYLKSIGLTKRALDKADSLRISIEASTVLYKRELARIYSTMSLIHEQRGEFKQALDYQRLSAAVGRSREMDNFTLKATQDVVKSQFESELQKQRQREIELRNESDSQRVILFCVLFVSILVVVVSILLFRNYRRIRTNNVNLDEKNAELERQTRLIERQKSDLIAQNRAVEEANAELVSGLGYASRIQQAAIPSERYMKNIFGDNLVLFRPLNLVSGDFYWAKQIGNLKFLAVGDSTGHGVPGAFLGMLGMSILDSVIRGEKALNSTPATLLDEVRDTFKKSLHQEDGAEDLDGIDLALVVLDYDHYEIRYAGAFRPAIVARHGELIRLDADHMPIGTHYNEKDHFTDHSLAMMHGDVVYLYSDGITDQFGYDANQDVKKFNGKRFRQLLQDIHTQPFFIQKERIENEMNLWRSPHHDGTFMYVQTDDILVVGVNVSNTIE